MWQPGWKGNLGGEWIHVYVWLSPFTILSKPSQHCLLISYIPIQNKKFFLKEALIRLRRSASPQKGILWCFSSVFRKTGDLVWTTDCASVLGVQTHKHIRKSVPLSQQFLSSVNMDPLPFCGGLSLNILEHLVAHGLGNIGLTRSRVCKIQPAGHIGLATYLCK